MADQEKRRHPLRVNGQICVSRMLGKTKLGGKDTETEEVAGSLTLINSCQSSPAGPDCLS